jgi:arginine N-succinyltransferase
MFLLRPARFEDRAAILELARLLDSPNLPINERLLDKRLTRSERAFREPGPPSAERVYQFVLVDPAERVVGTSAIFSKHGTPEMPHIYLRVGREERHASSVDISVEHRTLQLGASTDGPSEIGALILHPDARSRPGWPGKLLSWGRFAYMALHPASFENRILAEMRATLDPQGRSAFWRAFGKRFTGMTYAEADRRSAVDKKFILDLFPKTPFYASLLDKDVAQQLGEVHPEARPALRLLERAGFAWIGEIDPFDAGPYFGAALSEVVPVHETRRARIASGAPPEDADPWIVSAEEGESFRAVATRVVREEDEVRLSKDACRRLVTRPGDDVALTPLPVSRRGEQAHG